MISMNTQTTETLDPKLSRRNKIMINTRYSQDGRSTDHFYVDYNPKEPYSLFLMERVLDKSTEVDWYVVYGSDGERLYTKNKQTKE